MWGDFLVFLDFEIFDILNLKGPRPFFCQKTLKIAISIAKSKRNFDFLSTSNHRILHLTSRKNCRKNLRIFDCIDLKWIKQVFQYNEGVDFLTLNIFNLRFLHYRGLSFKYLY